MAGGGNGFPLAEPRSAAQAEGVAGIAVPGAGSVLAAPDFSAAHMAAAVQLTVALAANAAHGLVLAGSLAAGMSCVYGDGDLGDVPRSVIRRHSLCARLGREHELSVFVQRDGHIVHPHLLQILLAHRHRHGPAEDLSRGDAGDHRRGAVQRDAVGAQAGDVQIVIHQQGVDDVPAVLLQGKAALVAVHDETCQLRRSQILRSDIVAHLDAPAVVGGIDGHGLAA